MDGDEQKRHCAGCGCSVNNVAELSAAEAETVMSSQGRVCVRLTVDEDHNVLTRDGWIPRMLMAGAIAATVAGCSGGETSSSSGLSATSSGPSAGSEALDMLETAAVDAFDAVANRVVPGSRPHMVFAGGMIAPISSTRTVSTSPLPGP